MSIDFCAGCSQVLGLAGAGGPRLAASRSELASVEQHLRLAQQEHEAAVRWRDETERGNRSKVPAH
jgi:hypothetical protein